jgi:hypothetical protein
MRTRLIVYGITLCLVVVAVVILRSPPPTPKPRLITVLVTGPEGQHFTGSYLADGKWHIVSAVVPADIRVQTGAIFYGFSRDDDRKGDFCVSLYAEGLRKTSVTNSTGLGVIGHWVGAIPLDNCSARAVSDLKDLRLPNQPAAGKAGITSWLAAQYH